MEIKVIGTNSYSALGRKEELQRQKGNTAPLQTSSKDGSNWLTLTNNGKELFKSHHTSLLMTPLIC